MNDLTTLLTTTLAALLTAAPVVAPAGTTPGAPPPAWLQTVQTFGPLLLLGVVFYLILILPKRKQDKERTTMLAALKKGDRVQTYGGLKGTVLEVRTEENEVVLKVDEGTNTKIRFDLSAVQRVAGDAKADAKK